MGPGSQDHERDREGAAQGGTVWVKVRMWKAAQRSGRIRTEEALSAGVAHRGSSGTFVRAVSGQSLGVEGGEHFPIRGISRSRDMR